MSDANGREIEWCEEHECVADGDFCVVWDLDMRISGEWGVGPDDDPEGCSVVKAVIILTPP